MSDEIVAELVVAWLKRQDGIGRVSLLGMIFIPAKLIGHWMYGGVYIPGRLCLTDTSLYFEPDKLRNRLHGGSLGWSIALSDISEVVQVPGMVMGTMEVRHSGGTEKMKYATGGDAMIEALERKRAGL